MSGVPTREIAKKRVNPLFWIGTILIEAAIVISIGFRIPAIKLAIFYILGVIIVLYSNAKIRKGFRRFFREMKYYRMGLVGLLIIFFMAALALIAPFYQKPPRHIMLSAPSWYGQIFERDYYYPDQMIQYIDFSNITYAQNWLSVSSSWKLVRSFVSSYYIDEDKRELVVPVSDVPTIQLSYTEALQTEYYVMINVTAPWRYHVAPRIIEFSFEYYTTYSGGYSYSDFWDLQRNIYKLDCLVYLKVAGKPPEFVRQAYKNISGGAEPPFYDRRFGIIASSSITLSASRKTKIRIRFPETRLERWIFTGKYDMELVIALIFRYNPLRLSLRKTGAIIIHFSSFRVFIWSYYHGVFGTDQFGDDIWYRIVKGAQVSLFIGFVVAIMSVLVGTLLGIMSGYIGGKFDEILMRFVDFLLSIPGLPLLIVLVVIFDQMGVSRVWTIITLLTIFGWPGMTRVIRAQVLSLKARPFIESAKAAGAKPGYIMIRHILPNVLPLVFYYMVMGIFSAILSEASLSFLGLGLTGGEWDSWGLLLHDASQITIFRAPGAVPGQYRLVWWFVVFPGLFLALLLLALTYISQALYNMFAPRRR